MLGEVTSVMTKFIKYQYEEVIIKNFFLKKLIKI